MDKIFTFLLFGTLSSIITYIFLYNEVEFVFFNYKLSSSDSWEPFEESWFLHFGRVGRKIFAKTGEVLEKTDEVSLVL